MTPNFSDLPVELRIQIWEQAVFPRMVPIFTVVVNEQSPQTDIVCVKSCIPAPPIMQVCRESRRFANYQRAFTNGSKPRHTWVNWEYDMISCQWEDEVEDEDMRTLGQHASEIQRIHLTHLGLDTSKIHGNGWGVYDDVLYIINDKFPSAKEFHFLRHDGNLEFVVSKDEDAFIQGLSYARNIQSFDPSTGLTIIGEGTGVSASSVYIQEVFGGRHSERGADSVAQRSRQLRCMTEEMFSPSERRLMRIRQTTANSSARPAFD